MTEGTPDQTLPEDLGDPDEEGITEQERADRKAARDAARDARVPDQAATPNRGENPADPNPQGGSDPS